MRDGVSESFKKHILKIKPHGKTLLSIANLKRNRVLKLSVSKPNDLRKR